MNKVINFIFTKTKKRAPELLLTAGFICGGAAIVSACRETVKVQELKKTHTETMKQIDEAEKAQAELEDGSVYTPEIAKHDRYVARVQTGVKVVRTYLPSAGLTIASIACILASFKIIKARYAAALITAEGFKRAYDQLYARVEKKYGKEEAEALASGKETITITDKETGETKDIVVTAPADIYSVYVCPSTCTQWEDGCDEYNYYNISKAMEDANNALKTNKYLFLSSPLDNMGIKIPNETKAGMTLASMAAQVGWLYGNKKAEVAGIKSDGYVDFNIEKISRVDIADILDARYEKGEDVSDIGYIYDLFLNSKGTREDYIYKLTFNVDGPIWRYI